MRRLTTIQTVGLLLVAGGLLLILERLGIMTGGGAQLIIGAILIVLYIRAPIVSLIVVGLVLLAIGVSRGIEPPAAIVDGAWSLLWLGAAFALTFLIHTRRYRDRYRWWPLYPGVALWVVAGMVMLEGAGWMPAQAATALSFFWPIALIAVGVWLLTVGLRRRRQSGD